MPTPMQLLASVLAKAKELGNKPAIPNEDILKRIDMECGACGMDAKRDTIVRYRAEVASLTAERDCYKAALEKIRAMDGLHPDMVISLSLKIAKDALKQD